MKVHFASAILGAGFLLTACNLGASTPSPAPDVATESAAVQESAAPSSTPLAAAEATAMSAAAPSIPDPDEYGWQLVAQGFTQPLLVTHAGDDSGRLFVVEQDGAIWVLAGGQVLATPFIDLDERVGSEAYEQGLLGLAFHPHYADNGYFYVNYTDNNGDTVIARFSVSGDPNVADAASERVLLQIDQPYVNHNGGHLEFGPDGYLYIGVGDGGSGGDPQGHGQNPDSLLGSLLRIDVDNGDPYAIPADNPFAAGGGAPEIWAWGLRNPWRFSFDALTGDLHIADVGQNQYEEINFLPGGAAGGANFGWNYREGAHAYTGTPPEGLNLIDPVAEYDHSLGCSVTGGRVYRGSSLPAWAGVYIYGDFCSGIVFGLVQGADGQWINEQLYTLSANISSFGVDEDGEFYLVDRRGELYQLVAE